MYTTLYILGLTCRRSSCSLWWSYSWALGQTSVQSESSSRPFQGGTQSRRGPLRDTLLSLLLCWEAPLQLFKQRTIREVWTINFTLDIFIHESKCTEKHDGYIKPFPLSYLKRLKFNLIESGFNSLYMCLFT